MVVVVVVVVVILSSSGGSLDRMWADGREWVLQQAVLCGPYTPTFVFFCGDGWLWPVVVVPSPLGQRAG